ncbi:MAG: tRNA pseudouridine(38-40) synthase TruA [Raoultibacter sp.]
MDERYDKTLAITLAYNGSPFAGFARQPGLLTVQGNLEEMLALLFRRPIETTCAGRTDAGVHALGQVVSFNCSAEEVKQRSLCTLRRSLNALTDDSISICEIAEKPAGFSARFDATRREYHYHLCAQVPPPIFMRDFSWHITKELDLDAMREGAQYLIGEHDFKSFCMVASATGKPTHRNVHKITIEEQVMMGERIIVITVIGNAFLHSMVRSIVGTLVAVGRGKRESAWVGRALDACDRQAAGETAPAAGLVFWQVGYENIALSM